MGALGVAQTLAWASSYYLPAIVAAPMAEDYGFPPSAIFGAFSASLLLTALLGPWVGRVIDRRGGRGVLAGSNLALAAGLGAMALAPAEWPIVLFLGWGLLGLGMALGLYDSAFATLAGLYGKEARGPISGVAMMAGFASTIGWPLTAWLSAWLGWRGACASWAVLQLLLGLPLHLLLVPPAPPPPTAAASAEEPEGAAGWGQLALLALALTGSGFNIAAMAAHLPGLLTRSGASEELALLAASLVGPMQVLARVLDVLVLRRLHPLTTARLATAGHPAAALALAAGLGPAAFAILHGAGNGLLTIVRGTLPLALFGARGYGARQGIILAPMRLIQALAPLAFGLSLERLGLQALWIFAGVGLISLLALAALRRPG
ncbi:MFS transporter [Roseomonas sp. KE2513]|uniref:MFS transporter n=1 Tax=Roseomonas sp. KE2513 TaxID=2479202 RepID=UPI0028167BD0|nr:MFS transporter [Roseomonas sp. KE2513]